MLEKRQTSECPHCKEAHGWFEKRQHSFEQYYTRLGDPCFAEDSSSSLGRGGIRKYCFECQRDITKCVNEMEPFDPKEGDRVRCVKTHFLTRVGDIGTINYVNKEIQNGDANITITVDGKAPPMDTFGFEVKLFVQHWEPLS